MPLFGDPDSLERELLRAGVVHRLDAGRVPLRRLPAHAASGERVHVYEGGRVVCELCRPLRREEPIRCERVHGLERGPASRAVRAA